MRTVDKLQQIQKIIATFPEQTVVGRTRMQKTIYLLQRVGLETAYEFNMHFYGPYSDELTTDLEIGGASGFLTENRSNTNEGLPSYSFTVHDVPSVEIPAQVRNFLPLLSVQDPTILELAATYDAFRQKGRTPEAALESLHLKKGYKCDNGRDQMAIGLLKALGLEA